MQKSKLIDILKSLSAKELKQFSAYVHSPFFNNQEKPKELITILIREAPDYNEKALSKEKVFSSLYPGKNYIESRLFNLVSDLYKMLTDYLAYTNYREDSAGKRLHFLS